MKTKQADFWHVWEEYKENKSSTIDPDEPPTVYRLNRMISLGYEIDFRHGQEVRDVIYLKHPNKKTRNPIFYISGNGFMFESNIEKNQLRFHENDGKSFEDFCRSFSASSDPRYLKIPVPWLGYMILLPIFAIGWFLIFYFVTFIKQLF